MGNSCSSGDAAATKTTAAGTVRIAVVFYSMYGHMFYMAKSAAAGAEAAGATVDLLRIPETLPTEVLEKMHAVEAGKAFASVPVVDASKLAEYDGFILCSPTRFGSAPAQVQSVLDQTGGLWFTGALTGKVGSAIVSTATQHGGNEMTFRALHTFMLHHGMVISGLPGTFPGFATMGVEKASGCGPYGASTITGSDGSRMPSELELAGAKFQGEHVAKLAAKLK